MVSSVIVSDFEYSSLVMVLVMLLKFLFLFTKVSRETTMNWLSNTATQLQTRKSRYR